MYRSVDVSDVSAVRSAVAEAEARWAQPLAGVFHLAGAGNLERHAEAAEGHWAAHESLATFHSMFAAKILGTHALFEAIEERPHALFVAFSSVNGIFGGATFGAYSAANSGLDALCAARRATTHPRTYCFNWTMWDGLGMSAGAPAYARSGSRDLGYRILSSGQGLQSMLAGLHRRPRQLVVGLDASNRHIRRHVRDGSRPLRQVAAYYSAGDEGGQPALPPDWSRSVVDRFGTVCSTSITRVPVATWDAEGGPPVGGARAGHSAVATVAPRTEMEERIARIWREVLAVPDVGVRDRFFDVGGDSLLAMRMVNRLRESFGAELSLRALFEAPTIEELASVLSAAFRGSHADAPAKARAVDSTVAALSDDEVDAMLRRLTPSGGTGT
jgi:acyl carrier protein